MTYAKPDRIVIQKVIKKCSVCGELDYMYESSEKCDSCKDKEKKKNLDLLSF